ncbi:MAG TPA: small acid-soluble spore protein Tlp [Bacillota bacterium]|nr:small acid-soluble spore protein Tlp [Bacillota bacterium]
MTEKDKQPKPDDRSDNYDKLQSMVEDTAQNIEKSKETMEHISGKDKEALQEKNKRRKAAINHFEQEMEDESEN